MTPRQRLVVAGVSIVVMTAGAIVMWQLPAIGAGALLHPMRQPVAIPTPPSCSDAVVAGDGVRLDAWLCHTEGHKRGTIVTLHGVGDNRRGAVGIIGRYVPRGFDVIAYDSRAHGNSEGEVCTYGFHEKDDLRRVIDRVEGGPIVLFGASLGAAVALQEAAHDSRVTAVVAAEAFSDLRTVARERAPSYFTDATIERAFELAERQGRFRVDEVSPERAAALITVPVLLIHGAEDIDTPPDHSRRIFRALKGPKRLIVVPGAGHNHSLQPDVWPQIDAWIESAVGRE